jgi:hypothetical protein
MTGQETTKRRDRPGDPEFVNVIPVAQYMSSYVFFADPTYPETSLVVTRRKGADGRFAEVWLDCAKSPLSGWQSLGGDLEYARVDLLTGAFDPRVPGCDSGRQTIASLAPFAVTVWGWGSDDVRIGGLETGATSYAYPAGSAVRKVNDVPPPEIK